jgi:hypothetical protein
MMYIIRGQPWTLRNNNLLLEMYVQGRDTHDYAFQFLEVNVRLYGITSMFCTENHIASIINIIGHPSDWHRLNPRYFTADPHFVAVKIKLDATKPVTDKIFYLVPPVGTLGTIVIWVHYEKIKRICTFCAKLFHNAEHCPDRIQRILAAGEDINFDQFGLWMTQINRIPMQLVETQLTSFQDVLPGPSSALSELRQAFAGVSIGSSLGTHPRRPMSTEPRAPTQPIFQNTSAPLQTQTTTPADDMNVDNTAIVPLSAPTMHNTDPFQIQTQRPRSDGQAQQRNSASMLQFNQFNIRQTQVRVQVTTQADISPTFEVNQRHQAPNLLTVTESLHSQMIPMTAQQTPQHHSIIPIQPLGIISTPPTQQLQQSPGVHPGQSRNSQIDKGKSVLSHEPPDAPQTLNEHINPPQPMEQPQNPNFSQ